MFDDKWGKVAPLAPGYLAIIGQGVAPKLRLSPNVGWGILKAEFCKKSLDVVGFGRW